MPLLVPIVKRYTSFYFYQYTRFLVNPHQFVFFGVFPDFFRDFPLELSTSGYKTARDRHGSKTLLREARFKLTDFELAMSSSYLDSIVLRSFNSRYESLSFSN